MQRLLPQGPIGGCALLAALVLAAYLPAAWVAYGRSGQVGIIAAAIAAVVCLLPSMAALWVTHAFANTPQAIVAALGSILLRTMVPLLVTVVLVSASEAMAGAELMGLTFVFYLLTLSAETVLATRLVNAACRRPGGEGGSASSSGSSGVAASDVAGTGRTN